MVQELELLVVRLGVALDHRTERGEPGEGDSMHVCEAQKRPENPLKAYQHLRAAKI